MQRCESWQVKTIRKSHFRFLFLLRMVFCVLLRFTLDFIVQRKSDLLCSSRCCYFDFGRFCTSDLVRILTSDFHQSMFSRLNTVSTSKLKNLCRDNASSRKTFESNISCVNLRENLTGSILKLHSWALANGFELRNWPTFLSHLFHFGLNGIKILRSFHLLE